MKREFQSFVEFVRGLYDAPEGFIPLHEPRFNGNEKRYLEECIDSTFVSSVGEFVDRFEAMVAKFTGAKFAVAAVNGTSALHAALLLAGVRKEDEVITQPLAFVATANAIHYTGAHPVFVDVDRETLGLSPTAMRQFLVSRARVETDQDGAIYSVNRHTGRRISACVPMHTFGHPAKIKEIQGVCKEFGLKLVEDAAESLGSWSGSKHTGTFGNLGILSFNGNKTITTGGGGMILTDDEELARRAKHITTTAKVPHGWEYVHDMVGYNYRLTNLSAALGVAQMEQLPRILESKLSVAAKYREQIPQIGLKFVDQPVQTRSNFWLNAVQLEDRQERDAFLEYTNKKGIMTRPIWELLPRLDMYKTCLSDSIPNAEWLVDRIVNVPSSALF